MIAADFDYDTGDERVCALVFQIPSDARVSADLDATIDALRPFTEEGPCGHGYQEASDE